ncbi:hypothetical protein CLAFUW4_09879 [Fulvia fulva]|uniref:Uncharacterized protein n=1 Tax=Passalora fulva TaxID=5499 RepID=A0A9Q8PIW0_PASFU|nr:uncharacterized protein CLAFUR5_12360 [Fulvia fulva]KAK4615304.1 hypothetical protein CLAFUR4_09884 [Fulvia fulva]KAK4616880.1 hypothetical protein CLAFUR0_09878 [Fulvia fulva]UJO23227.1 hypothetical protein CLAFUR5_12360 [Fulvia fulva]WPV18726.1 hypothetical protein CLAFUW4_09879 [Fulvia fulva]WPV34564.1 hypothetical protein CLAFUW7_09881 [Fulvia fulva]
MKPSTFVSLVSFTTLAAAAPADHIRRANDIGHQVKAPINARQAYPTGTAIYPTGTAPPVPISTGSASCPVDGAVVCNGPNYFGLCNFGSVVWQRVSDGTACVDGQIVGTGIYGVPAPTASGGAYYKA